MNYNTDELNEILCKFDVISALVKTTIYAYEHCINNSDADVSHLFELIQIIDEQLNKAINDFDKLIIKKTN